MMPKISKSSPIPYDFSQLISNHHCKNKEKECQSCSSVNDYKIQYNSLHTTERRHKAMCNFALPKLVDDTAIDECRYEQDDFAKSEAAPVIKRKYSDDDNEIIEYEDRIEKLGFHLERELDFIYKNINEIQTKKASIAGITSSLFSKKILVLDLDETLIHTSNLYFSITSDAQMCSAVNKCGQFFFKKRPYLNEFLHDASKLYDIVVFTASEKDYADAIIEKIDPNNFIKKVYYKDACTIINGRAVKNLSIITPNMSNIVIVDNLLISFAMQLSNGICIKNFEGDINEKELLLLKFKLQILLSFDDIRTGLKSAYDYEGLYELYKKIYSDGKAIKPKVK